MSETAKRDTAEMRYLLGNLSEDDTTRMEEAFFADDSKFEAIEIAEDELIDSYVQNQLSPKEREQFEARCLTSARLAERVNFARALSKRANSQVSPAAIEPRPSFSSPAPEPKARWAFFGQPAWGMAMAACAVVLMIASVVLVSAWLRLRNQSEQLADERTALQRQKEELVKLSNDERTRAEQLSAELQQARELQAKNQELIDKVEAAAKLKESQTGQPSLSTFATVFLTPGSLRSGGGVQSELTIGVATTTAQVTIALLKNDSPSYRVELRTVNDDTLVLRKNLKPHETKSGAQLLLSLPANLLSTNDYKIHVDGVTASGQLESVDDYQFRVVKSGK